MLQTAVQAAGIPSSRSLSHLRARDSAGWLVVGTASVVLGAGIWLSLQDSLWAWAAGQVVLALALLQWFVILHEAGHNTLFRTRSLNRLTGHVASVPVLIPFHNWRRIHGRHHKYTGWQDLDATTALLVPRAIRRWEQWLMDFCWATGLPLFSILYRVQNFWNLQRVARYLERAEHVRAARRNAFMLGLFYLGALVVVGPVRLVTTVGPGLLLSLMAQDVILLSQHTHMPSNLSHGVAVRPFPPIEQGSFTRSLRLPEWLSRFLLRFDLHELHHMYVQVPGYDLHRIPYRAPNEVNWLDWTREAKRLPGTRFLFGKSEQTGLRR